MAAAAQMERKSHYSASVIAVKRVIAVIRRSPMLRSITMNGVAPWEIGLFVAVGIASLAAFWWRARTVVANIRGSKPDPDFSLHPLGHRIRRFLSEVVLQHKVIVERPLAGVAHAFVFWGFCAFALVTLNHLAAGFGIELLPR